jgi:thiamine pyrophosphate-dependent acetolactate synthase large subunit-like protein
MLPATLLWPIDEPSGLLISNGLSTMGYALPAAVGAALLDRDRPVVALTGDGGLLMCAGELLTAVRERLRIIVIVFNDASLSLIEIKQQARRLDPLASRSVTSTGLEWPTGLAFDRSSRQPRSSSNRPLRRRAGLADGPDRGQN